MTRYPVKVLVGTVLNRISFINDLGVIMDNKMKFSDYVDVRVGNIFAMLFSVPYTLKSLYTSSEIYEPMSATMCEFNEIIDLFDFILTRNQFLNQLKLHLFLFLRLNSALRALLSMIPVTG
jgi:hypothetical protein